MNPAPPLAERLGNAVSRERLLDTAVRLVAVPSRTGEAGAAADRLAELLAGDGFAVERPAAGHPSAPAVVARQVGPGPGPPSSSTATSTPSTCRSCRRRWRGAG
jgi:hypothetical protein